MHRLTRPVMWLLCAFVLEWGACGASAEEAPDPELIVEAGYRTEERLKREYAAWTSIIELGTKSVRVDVVFGPNIRRSTFRLEINGRQKATLVIIERDGAWYVVEPGTRAKYEPYAAPLSMPSYYHFLTRSHLMFVAPSLLEGEYAGLQNGRATYVAPLDPPQQAPLRGLLRSMRALQAQHPEDNDEELEKRLRDVEDVLENGIKYVVNVETGVAEEYGPISKRTWVEDFRWLEGADESLFTVDDLDWVDRSANLVENCESPDDLAVICNFPSWRPTGTTRDLDRMIVDVKSREYRRIPYSGGKIADACLSLDRRHAYVVGDVVNDGGISLLEIDLRSGEHRRLGGPELQHDVKLYPSVSPDGRTLAVVQMEHATGLEKARVYVVDIASGESKAVGPVLDMSELSWLPDGKGLIVMVREPNDKRRQALHTICRIDLDGKLTKIRAGHEPVVLHADARILFQGGTGQWQTCSLEGGDLRLVGDGLKGFDDPTVSPDGKQLLMMKMGGAQGPVPHLVDLATGQATPLSLGPGLWAYPKWR